jgi:hypothetical protein
VFGLERAFDLEVTYRGLDEKMLVVVELKKSERPLKKREL